MYRQHISLSYCSKFKLQQLNNRRTRIIAITSLLLYFNGFIQALLCGISCFLSVYVYIHNSNNNKKEKNQKYIYFIKVSNIVKNSNISPLPSLSTCIIHRNSIELPHLMKSMKYSVNLN